MGTTSPLGGGRATSLRMRDSCTDFFLLDDRKKSGRSEIFQRTNASFWVSVSYEDDQIYSFFLNDCAREYVYEGPIPFEPFQSDLASYGGHLNRDRTAFPKNVKYAGPNDECICTGSA